MGKPRILEDFIIPNLETEYFGERLKWNKKSEKIFEVCWKHKKSPTWTEEDSLVFKAWDRMKNRPTDGDNYEMRAKGRFRSALRKIPAVIELVTGNKNIRRYEIIAVQRTRKLSQERKMKLALERKIKLALGRKRKLAQEVYEDPSSPESYSSFYRNSSSSPMSNSLTDEASGVEEEQSHQIVTENTIFVNIMRNSEKLEIGEISEPYASPLDESYSQSDLEELACAGDWTEFFSDLDAVNIKNEFDNFLMDAIENPAVVPLNENSAAVPLDENSAAVSLDENSVADEITVFLNANFDPESFLNKNIFKL